MGVAEILAILGGIASVTSIGESIYGWLKAKEAAGAVDDDLHLALKKLSPKASADDILKVLQPFYAAKGGDLQIKAGSNGSGNLNFVGSSFSAGSGAAGGGEVKISGGDGGPDGPGGSITISNSRFQGGNVA